MREIMEHVDIDCASFVAFVHIISVCTLVYIRAYVKKCTKNSLWFKLRCHFVPKCYSCVREKKKTEIIAM